jgi:hypothetical protein
LNTAKKPEDLSSSLTNFQPLDKVDKYEKIQHNGDTISMLNIEEGGYSFTYINSLEMLQAVFGYLPAVKAEQYEDVSRVINKRAREKSGESEMSATEAELVKAVNNIREYIPMISLEYFDSYEESVVFRAEIRVLWEDELVPFVGKDLKENFDKIQEICQKINIKYLDVLEKHKNMTPEEAEQARNMSVGNQSQLIKNILNK